MKCDEVNKLMLEGFNCAQIVSTDFSKDLNVDEILLKKMSACFGGGMGCGDTCGAFTGALMVIGLKFGNYLSNDIESRKKAREKADKFRELFLEEYDSTLCKELLGYDVSRPEDCEIIQQKELFTTFCSDLIAYTIEILKEIL